MKTQQEKDIDGARRGKYRSAYEKRLRTETATRYVRRIMGRIGAEARCAAACKEAGNKVEQNKHEHAVAVLRWVLGYAD